MATLDRTRPLVGAQALGIAQGALDYALSYAKNRVQFGQPIASFQGLQFVLAEMATKIEAARQLVYKAAFFIESAGQAGVIFVDQLPKTPSGKILKRDLRVVYRDFFASKQ